MQVKFRHAALLLGSAIFLTVSASAQNAQQIMTLEQALSSAYYANPTMNAKRAQVRVTDELVPQALAGYRPKVQGNAEIGLEHTRTQTPVGKQERNFGPRGYGVTAQQNLFNGFQTGNLTRSAESQVLGAREDLRFTEQEVLYASVTSYMNVIRDTAIVQLRRQNLRSTERATSRDTRPLQCRRTDTNRCRAGAGACCRYPNPC